MNDAEEGEEHRPHTFMGLPMQLKPYKTADSAYRGAKTLPRSKLNVSELEDAHRS
jgi:hypothetical protein